MFNLTESSSNFSTKFADSQQHGNVFVNLSLKTCLMSLINNNVSVVQHLNINIQTATSVLSTYNTLFKIYINCCVDFNNIRTYVIFDFKKSMN